MELACQSSVCSCSMNGGHNDTVFFLVIVLRNVAVKSSHTLHRLVLVASPAIVPWRFGHEKIADKHHGDHAVLDVYWQQPVQRMVPVDKVHHKTAGDGSSLLQEVNTLLELKGLPTKPVQLRSSLLGNGWCNLSDVWSNCDLGHPYGHPDHQLCHELIARCQ